eukprot:334437-Ditylum_brightwellii.AAC.1
MRLKCSQNTSAFSSLVTTLFPSDLRMRTVRQVEWRCDRPFSRVLIAFHALTRSVRYAMQS